MPTDRSPEIVTVLYDADCGFCQACVDGLRPRLGPSPPRFVPLESPEGRTLRNAHDVPDSTDSVIVLDAGGPCIRSDAVLALLERCRFPWNLLRAGRVAPRPWRDGLYDLVARNRHRFAKRGCRTG